MKTSTAFFASSTTHVVVGVAVFAIAAWAVQEEPEQRPEILFTEARLSVEPTVLDPIADLPPEELQVENLSDLPVEELFVEEDAPEWLPAQEQLPEFEEPQKQAPVEEAPPLEPSQVAPPVPEPSAVIEAVQKKPGRCQPPRYPARARAKGWEGDVELLVDVSPSGAVKGVRITQSSGYDILDTAALQAVLSWEFEAARRNGIPEESEYRLVIRFRQGGVSRG